MRERKRTIVTRDSRQKKRFFFQKHVFRLFLFTSSPNRDSCLSCTDFLNKRKRRRGRRKELDAFRRFSREGESHERRSLLLTLVNCIFTGDRYRPSYACFCFTWEETSDANAEEERSAFEKLFVYFWFAHWIYHFEDSCVVLLIWKFLNSCEFFFKTSSQPRVSKFLNFQVDWNFLNFPNFKFPTCKFF